MKLSVNTPQRYAKMRAHTATHLLHAVLTSYFPNTKQAGSLVDSDFLRFDFYADSLLNSDQLSDIENTINQQIYEALPISITETSFDEAVKLWAKAFFEEKYWDIVRLIRVHNWETCISAELCWWTHVQNTKDIWAFTIISQEAVASGIKRISATTWPKVIEKLHNYQSILNNQVSSFDLKSYAQITEKTSKLLKEYDEMKSKLESLETQLLNQLILSNKKEWKTDFEITIELPNSTNFKQLPQALKHHFPSAKSILSYTPDWNYLILTNWEVSAKSLSHKYQLKWGGSDISAQWKDIQVLSIINS